MMLFMLFVVIVSGREGSNVMSLTMLVTMFVVMPVIMRVIVMSVFMSVIRRVITDLRGIGWLRGFRFGGRAFDNFALHALAAVTASRTAMAGPAAAGAVFRFFLGLAVRALVGLDQGLTIGNRDLIVVRMNFAEGEKAMTIAAVFDEGGLQRRLDARDLGEIDIAAQLLALGRLEIKFLDAIAADHDHPGLFRMSGIDQHFVGHL